MKKNGKGGGKKEGEKEGGEVGLPDRNLTSLTPKT